MSLQEDKPQGQINLSRQSVNCFGGVSTILSPQNLASNVVGPHVHVHIG